MALVQIRIPPSGDRVIWAKLSQAAKLVARGEAVYVDTTPPALETTAMSPPRNAALRTGRAVARRPGKPG